MLEDDGETPVSETTLRLTFKAIDLYYGKGNKQNVLHNTKGVVDQRNEYVRRCLENINEKIILPIRPEVFLDESYCHLSHQASIPACVRNSKIAPDLVDYHGNFNADIFEGLFKKLCHRLKNEFEGCVIHMDGAKYHFRIEYPPHPPSNTLYADMLDWCLKKSKKKKKRNLLTARFYLL
jgi:hypothetical protein